MQENTQKQSNNSTSTVCLVKSKYLGSWDKREVEVDLEQNKLLITKQNKIKEFPLSEVKVKNNKKDQITYIRVSKNREYQIKTDKEDIAPRIDEIEMFHQSQFFIGKVKELKFIPPKKINYFAPLRSRSYEEGFFPAHSSMSMKQKKSLKSYPRRNSYINELDWKRDPKKGGVLFINEQKKSMISKIIGFICKKVISTGSFMGISFPTFAMKPQSMLETYCKCLGTVPLILQNIPFDPIERIKAFNAIILALSLQFNDIDKPFNPTIGQTYQGQIGGFNVYAEQTSHHPPISSFLLDGKNYVLHGSLQLNAKLGLNSAVGMFYGQLTLQFDDGGVVKGRMPCGVMSNVIVGQTHFGPTGASYSYDPMNHLVCSYNNNKHDFLTGYIGKMKQKPYKKFLGMLQQKSLNKYENFKHIPEKDYQYISCRMNAKWASYVTYDDKQYIDYLQEQWMPIIMTQKITGEVVLESDSSKRHDIELRGQGKIDESQQAKEEIEEEERRLRKLRQKYKN